MYLSTSQLFARLSSLVSASKDRITTVRENLQACKVLLSCRHEELKKLWLEGVEHKHMIQLLDDMWVSTCNHSQLLTFGKVGFGNFCVKHRIWVFFLLFFSSSILFLDLATKDWVKSLLAAVCFFSFVVILFSSTRVMWNVHCRWLLPTWIGVVSFLVSVFLAIIFKYLGIQCCRQ